MTETSLPPLALHLLMLLFALGMFVACTFYPGRTRRRFLEGADRSSWRWNPFLESSLYNVVIVAAGLGAGAAAVLLLLMLVRRLQLS